MKISPTQHLCPNCAHYRVRARITPLRAEDLTTPGAWDASHQWRQREQQQEDNERRLFERGVPFDFEPHFFPWCWHYTEHEPSRMLDPATGGVRKIYALCSYRNPDGRCAAFAGHPGAAIVLPSTPARSDGLVPIVQASSLARAGIAGYIHVGQKLLLVKRPRASGQMGDTLRTGSTVGSMRTDGDQPPYSAVPGTLSGEELIDTLETSPDACLCPNPLCQRTNRLGARYCSSCRSPLSNGHAFIADDGLAASYGIFGAPGAGKTHLFLHLLRQILTLHKDDPQRKCGAIIFDPKAGLIGKVRAMAREVGRIDDLIVVDTDELSSGQGAFINVIDMVFEPGELGKVLVMAAQSAGIGASEPFWFSEMTRLLDAAYILLKEHDSQIITLRRLIEAVLYEPIASTSASRDKSPLHQPYGAKSALDAQKSAESAQRREIQQIAAHWKGCLFKLPAAQRGDIRSAITVIEQIYQTHYIGTVLAFVNQAYGTFLLSHLACYSPEEPKPPAGVARRTFYDRIIEEGTIVLITVAPDKPALAKTLCTLMKCLFQLTVLGRLRRCNAGTLKNFDRQLLLACDEYSQIASEVPGQPMGDGHFFSLAREMKCMGLIATQSVNVLQASSLKENWRSVFSTLSATMFMRAVDNETIKEATELVGKSEWYIDSQGMSYGASGQGSSTQRSIQERQKLAVDLLRTLPRGQAVVIGSLDGGVTTGRDEKVKGVYFVQVPDNQRDITGGTT